MLLLLVVVVEVVVVVVLVVGDRCGDGDDINIDGGMTK